MTDTSEIFFRASGIGALMTEGRGKSLTEKQAETLADLQSRQKLPKNKGKPLTS
jgi:hypothetical protein